MADAKEAADPGDVKHAGLKRKLDLVLQYVKILFEGNPLLLHFTLLPIAFFACYLLGWFITWVTVLVLSISLMTQRISERKKEFYDRAALELAAKERKDVETCEWLNTLVKKYCTTCMESHVLPVIKEQLQNNQVPLVTKMSVKKCNFGESFPRIESANTVRGLSSRNYQTDFMLTFNSDAYIEVKLVLVKGMKVIIRVDEVYISGNLRLKMHFNAEFPALSTASVCFVDDPVISFSVKAMNSGDLMSLLGPIEEMIMQAIQTPIREEMVFPQVLCWNFSGERQTADKPSGPIADIQVIFKKEKYVPPNYKVLSKSISGTGTGNVNSKIGDDIYLCYKPKKDSDAETLPITGICVVQSYLDPKDRGFLRLFPADFTPYITTASTTIANLNGGNSGIPTFLGFRRDNINPPITHIGLYNKTVNEHLPPNYSILFATPDGGKANLNAGVPKADEVYLVYQGGTPSSFGYLKAPVAPGERGTLQVTVISGEGLKIADITGSSDPFAVVYVGSPGSKAPSGSEKTRTIYKNLDPIWNDTFLLRAAPGDCLHIQMYDEDPGLRNDKLGIAVIPLDNLERGKPLERSYKLQKVSRGRVKINVVALDFGLEPTDIPYNKESFTQISVENKKNSSSSNVFKEDHGDDDTSESVDVTKMEYKFKDGFVEKLPSQRNILYSGWKRRWCVLRQESLCFSKHKDSNSEPKSISLIGSKLETNNETGQIIVRRDGKTLTMRVGGTEFDQWVSFLKNNILVATARNPLHFSSSSSGSISRDPKDESSEQAPVSSSSNEPALTRSASRALKRLKK